jgi:hypothetical protein
VILFYHFKIQNNYNKRYLHLQMYHHFGSVAAAGLDYGIDDTFVDKFALVKVDGTFGAVTTGCCYKSVVD